MALRILKYLIGGIVLVLAVTGALAGFNYYFPPTYEAVAKLADPPAEVIIQLVPTHPYLAEYHRTLVLRKAGSPDQKVEMFEDTGGYSRAQLYKLPDGKFLVSSFFDAFVIDLSAHRIAASAKAPTNMGVYLGAFDYVRRSNSKEWKFIDSSQSAEQELVAQGG